MAAARFAPVFAPRARSAVGTLVYPPPIRGGSFKFSSTATFRFQRPTTPSGSSTAEFKERSFIHGFSSFASPFCNQVQGICHLAQAINGKDDVILEGARNQCTAEAAKHILEMANRASSRREALHTYFLTPTVLKESLFQLEKLSDVKAMAQGGYPEAERCRLSVGNSEALTNMPDIVAGLCITGNFVFQPCSHGDFLGAILGTGISRDKLGDIILQDEKGAQILVVPEIVSFLISSLEKVGNVPVTCREIPLFALEYKPARTKSFKTVEASLRLDAVASAGFKTSRTKMAELVSNRDVRINWTTATKSSTTLKTGDTISVDGKGRLKIGEINTTKKGKFAIELIQYL